MPQKVLQFFKENVLVGEASVFIDQDKRGSLICSWKEGTYIDIDRVRALGFSEGVNPEQVLLAGSRAKYVGPGEPHAKIRIEANLRCHLLDGELSVIATEFELTWPSFKPDLVWVIRGDRDGPNLVRWYGQAQFKPSFGDGLLLSKGQHGEITLIASVKDEAFDDQRNQSASRFVFRRNATLAALLKGIVRQKKWAGGELFPLQDWQSLPAEALEYNDADAKTSRLAVRLSARAVFQWWNSTVAEILLSALRTVQDGGFASFIPELSHPPGTDADKFVQLRFSIESQGGNTTEKTRFQIGYEGIRVGNGDLHLRNDERDPAGILLAKGAQLYLNGFMTREGRPLLLQGDVRVVNSDDKDTRYFWHVFLENLSVAQPSLVRMGALDLTIQDSAEIKNAKIEIILDRVWIGPVEQADQTVMKWFFDENGSPSEMGPCISYVSLLTGKLPLKEFVPGSQDELTSEQYTLNSPFTDLDSTASGPRKFEREEPLLIPLSKTSGILWLKLGEKSSPHRSHESQLTIMAKEKIEAGATAAIVLDLQPFQIAKIESLELEPSENEDIQIAIWSSGVSGGPSWQMIQPKYRLKLPPQAVGEASEKWLATRSTGSGSAGVPAEDGPDLMPDQLADMRFGTNAWIDFDSTYFEQNFGEPGWNLRRLMGDVGQRDPGVRVRQAEVELLYGLNCKITYEHLRLAEMMARLGEVPAQLPVRAFGRKLEGKLDKEMECLRRNWAAIFAAYLSRIAILEPRDERDFREETVRRDGILLTQNIVYHLRSPEDTGPYGGLPATPRLRYPISKDRLAVTPAQTMPSRDRHHADDASNTDDASTDIDKRRKKGLPGGFHWGFESAAIYEEVWQNRSSSSAELAQLAFSALGGYGKVKARFANDKTIIQAHVSMGRAHYYTVERIGRIAVFWTRAKHVIVYERSVTPSPQFADYQDPHLGRPVFRKVKEYIEILEPEKWLPEKNAAPEDCGPARGIIFHDRIISVHGGWGRDVYADPQRLVPIGWEIPLWKAEGVDQNLYPKPRVSIRLPADGANPEQRFLAASSNPQDLWFFTDTRKEATADVMSWPPVYGVDYRDAVLPPLYLDNPSYAGQSQTLEGDLDPPIELPPGFERFTFQVDRTEQKANLVADRTARGQVNAILKNITMMRATAAPGFNSELQSSQANAAAITTALESQFRDVVEGVRSGTLATAAEIRGAMVQQMTNAFVRAEGIKVPTNLPAPPADAWCQQPLVHRFIERPIREQIALRRKQVRESVGEELFGPWRKILQEFDERSGEDLETAKARLQNGLITSASRLHDRWVAIDQFVSALLDVPQRFLTQAEEQARRQIDQWMLGWEDQIKPLPQDQFEPWLNRLEASGTKALSADDGVFMREFGKILKPWLQNVEVDDPQDNSKQINAWQLIELWQKAAKDELKKQIDECKEVLTSSGLEAAKEVIKEGLKKLRDQITNPDPKKDDPKKDYLLHDVAALVRNVITGWVEICEKPLLTLNRMADLSENWIRTALVPAILQDVDDAGKLRQRTVEFARDRLTDFEARYLELIFDPPWRLLESRAQELVQELCSISWSLFPIDLAGVTAELKKWLSDAGAWAAQVEELFETYSHDAKKLAEQIQRTGQEVAEQVRDLTARAQEDLANAQRVANATQALAYAGSAKVRAFRMFCESPDIFPVKFNRPSIALMLSEGRKALDMTPVVARFQEAQDSLAALGLRLPSKELLDRIVPAKLDAFDINRIFSDLGGIRFDDFLPYLKMPSLSDDNIKVSHGFDKEALRAWVRADAAVDLPPDSTLFSIGPVAVTLRSGNFKAHVDMDTDAQGRIRKVANGSVRGNWDVTIGGTSIVTFRDTALLFQDGRLRFDLQPGKIELQAVLKMLSDLLPDMGGQSESEDGPGVSVALTTVTIAGGIKIPSGVRVKLDLPLPDIGAGTFAISGLQLGAFFRLRALSEDLQFDFQLATGFNLGRKTAPFTLTLFILGGGGWIEVSADYAPKHQTLSTSVSIGITASAVLAINLGVVKGSVGVYLGVFAEFHAQRGSASALAVGVMIMFRGEVDVLGIVRVYLMLLLEAIYQKDAGGSRLIGRGTVELRIKICWCFTLKVKKSVTYKLAGSSAGESARRSFEAPQTEPAGFATRLNAANHQAALLK